MEKLDTEYAVWIYRMSSNGNGYTISSWTSPIPRYRICRMDTPYLICWNC